jgi:tetratricopeptide (TPR) repeat protein
MISIIKRALFYLAVGCLSPALFAAQTLAADIWIKVESPNFDLVGNASKSQITDVAQRLERFRAAVHKLFAIEQHSKHAKIRVVVFKDSASFRPFKPRLADGTSDDLASGYFLSGDDLDYIAVAADGSISDIFHEYSHALLARRLDSSDIPPWLNEGLAEYLKSFRELDDKSVEFGSIHSQHLKTLQADQLMPWDKLLRLDNFTLQQSGRAARSLFYAQSWALVRFIISKKSEASINEIADSLSKTNNDLDIAIVEAGINDFISQKSLMSATRRLRSESKPVSLEHVALSEAKSNAYLGDLLYHLRDESAENYVLKSLASEPNLSMTNATLGLIRLRQRRFDDAKILLEKALASDKNNFLTNYYCAFLIARESMDEFGNIERLPIDAAQKMRFYLNASISLNQSFADSYKLLAAVNLIAGDDLDSALVTASRAQILQPSDDDIAILLARINARLNKFNEAKLIAEKVIRRSANTYLRKEAAAIITASEEMMATSSGDKRFNVGVTARERITPVILKWRDLTPEQIAKIQEEREINNVNILLDKPAVGESLALGVIDQIICRDERINYRFRTADGVLRFVSRDFNDIRLTVLTAGTRSFVLKCGTEFSSELTVARYRPSNKFSDNAGTLISITFVPKNFKLKPLEQIAREPLVIIEGAPAVDVNENLKTSQAERIEMERVMRESQIAELNERLRQPEPLESRIVAVPETVECKDQMIYVTARTGTASRVFQAPIGNKISVNSFAPDTGVIEFGCRAKLPPINAVVTYVESKARDGRALLVAIEFVPKSFELK